MPDRPARGFAGPETGDGIDPAVRRPVEPGAGSSNPMARRRWATTRAVGPHRPKRATPGGPAPATRRQSTPARPRWRRAASPGPWLASRRPVAARLEQVRAARWETGMDSPNQDSGAKRVRAARWETALTTARPATARAATGPSGAVAIRPGATSSPERREYGSRRGPTRGRPALVDARWPSAVPDAPRTRLWADPRTVEPPARSSLRG